MSKIFSSNIVKQLSSARLIEEAIKSEGGRLSDSGALVCTTGRFTGRSPKDKFIVKEELTSENIDWNDINQGMSESNFTKLYRDVLDFVKDKRLYQRFGYACSKSEYRLSLSFYTTRAWQSLFFKNLFIEPRDCELEANIEEDFTIISVPDFEASVGEHGTRGGNFTVINFKERIVLIGGTEYAGEIKKSVFTILNYLLPVERGVLPMHCSATIGADGDTAIFFGLSGTGKTTLSADCSRRLIGDDEHGWDNESIFNFEGGCYAKTIGLTREREPDIFDAIKFGSVLENVCLDGLTGGVNYFDKSITENCRAAYSLDFVNNKVDGSIGGCPRHIFFLTCDVYGVLPPISRLTKDQAAYYFLSGFTSKIAGTESGITEPTPTFSTCFGAAFLPLNPIKYMNLFIDKIDKLKPEVWLINTGWVGGGVNVGERIELRHTRNIVNAVLSGALAEVSYDKLPIFNLSIPMLCKDVPTELLDPRKLWQNKSDYDNSLKRLASLFGNNFKKYENIVDVVIVNSGPQLI